MINKKTRYFLALFVMSVFLFQNCLTMARGTYQGIPVTGSPTGAQILVDGEAVGTVPMNLRLKRKRNHVIRVEKDGYNPFEIRTTDKAPTPALIWPGIILGNAALSLGTGFLGGLVSVLFRDSDGYVSDEEIFATMGAFAIGTVVGFFVFFFKDLSSGATDTLSPQELNVTLTKIEGEPQPTFIFINAEKFQAVKWIRVKCDDSNEDEIVNLDYRD